MSITVSSYKQIHDSPLNQSITKQQYSFSKSPRFDRLENLSYCQQAYYDTNSMNNSVRQAGIGYGKKFEFGKNSSWVPAPNKYNLKGEIDDSLDKKKGFQFGVSRDKMEQQSILGGINKITPGPGRYSNASTLSNIKFTMRAKTDTGSLQLHKPTPGYKQILLFTEGPGTYAQLPALTPKGEYNFSKFRNSGASIINPKTQRFDDFARNVPGPGKYNLDKLGLQDDGKYFVSKLSSTQCTVFPHEIREIGLANKKDQNPGPGAYRLPSEFGHYEARRYASFDQLPKLH